MKNSILTLFLLHLAVFGYSQDSVTNELGFNVNRVYPYISISEDKLKEAHTILDFKNQVRDNNLEYNPSWVKEYISVEILTSYKGEIKKAGSKNDTLSQEQKDIMMMADTGSDISVKIQYIPENTLTHNDPKELNFTFTVDPASEAKYPGGQQQLEKYLKEKAIDKIPDASFENYDLAAVKFTISEEGEIIDAHIFDSAYQTYKNEKINGLLLETIRNMPCWKPAEYTNGSKVKQGFVLTVGNMSSCVVNLLNISRE